MKNFRAKSGPFKERPYYTFQEVERICEDALRAANLYPAEPEPIRIDRLIEKHFKVTPIYEDIPDGVLGFTRFGDRGVHSVVVAKALDEEGTTAAQRRIRTTLAHEAGHGLLHAHLFVLGSGKAHLFGDFSEATKPKVLCREVSTGQMPVPRSYTWWEYQANLAIGAFLLPRDLVEHAIESLLVPAGLLGSRVLPSVSYDQAAKNLAGIFDVNPAVTRIRLQELYPQTDQLPL